MRTQGFAVNLSTRTIDETRLTWDHPVRITAGRAFLVGDLAGTNPAWIHAAGGDRLASFLFYPPAGDGSRRVANVLDQLPIELAAGEVLTVWGIRAEVGGVFRVELDYARLRSRRLPECALTHGASILGRLGVAAGNRRG